MAKKLDQSLLLMDEWDLIQAAWEFKTEELKTQYNPDEIIESLFPEGQSKEDQISCLEGLIDEFLDLNKEPKGSTTTEFLERILKKVINIQPWLYKGKPMRNGYEVYSPRLFWCEYLHYQTIRQDSEGNWGWAYGGYEWFAHDLFRLICIKKRSGLDLSPVRKETTSL